MKVFVICVFPPLPLPEADHAFHMVRHLADAGAAVEVLTSTGSVGVDQPNVTQWSVMERWNWSEAPRLVRRLQKSKPDAVLLYYFPHFYHDHPMITFLPTLARMFLPSVPVVTYFPQYYGASPSKFGVWGKLVHKALRALLGKNTSYGFGTLLRDSRRIILMSRQHLERFVDALPQVADKSTLVPPPPIMLLSPPTPESRNTGRMQLAADADTFLFAYFGYLYPGKGIETLVRAFALLAAEDSAVRLALIGSVSQFEGGPEYGEKVRQLVRSLDLEEKIVFTGKFDWDSTQGSVYLRAADACVLPFSGGIQMNNSSFAAVVAHGLPVVTTAGPMLEDPFLNGENVFLCPPEDPEAMAAAMRQVRRDAALRCCLSQGAVRFSEEWFSWNSATARTLAALQFAV